jgi:hypothetical protein
MSPQHRVPLNYTPVNQGYPSLRRSENTYKYDKETQPIPQSCIHHPASTNYNFTLCVAVCFFAVYGLGLFATSKMLPQGLDKPAAALLFIVSGERETFSGTEKELTKISLW